MTSDASAFPSAVGDIEFRHWGRAPIFLIGRNQTPTSAYAFHFKEDGAVGDKPSLAFELRDAAGRQFFHEITVQTLADLLAKAGYQLTRGKL